ncbi:hypothetical protein ColTof4_14348 [Colletotrichum tofieldiae]|nr:hypothetical protein ColTof3_14759 [Colletotrichum tofieldiae]GKT81925.1 hypothetical protein ColTof4_14348 [Colletotrichum tofieldiae]
MANEANGDESPKPTTPQPKRWRNYFLDQLSPATPDTTKRRHRKQIQWTQDDKNLFRAFLAHHRHSPDSASDADRMTCKGCTDDELREIARRIGLDTEQVTDMQWMGIRDRMLTQFAYQLRKWIEDGKVRQGLDPKTTVEVFVWDEDVRTEFTSFQYRPLSSSPLADRQVDDKPMPQEQQNMQGLQEDALGSQDGDECDREPQEVDGEQPQGKNSQRPQPHHQPGLFPLAHRFPPFPPYERQGQLPLVPGQHQNAAPRNPTAGVPLRTGADSVETGAAAAERNGGCNTAADASAQIVRLRRQLIYFAFMERQLAFPRAPWQMRQHHAHAGRGPLNHNAELGDADTARLAEIRRGRIQAWADLKEAYDDVDVGGSASRMCHRGARMFGSILEFFGRRFTS